MTASGFDVIVCGSLHLDIVALTPHIPRLDETAVGRSWRQVCGGKGGNQAVRAREAGARVAMIGRTGDDDFGQRLRAHLRDNGVDMSEVATDADQGSGMSVALIDDRGDYAAVIVSGANLSMTPEGVAAGWTRLGGARVLVLQHEVPHEVNVAAARAARAAGAQVVLNVAPLRPVDAALMDAVDIVIANRIEADLLVGRPVADRADALAALSGRTDPRQSVVITLGGDGLVVVPAGRPPVALPAVPVAVRSTHGAGDCFVGTLAARLAAGDDLLDACAAANAAAAAFVTR